MSPKRSATRLDDLISKYRDSIDPVVFPPAYGEGGSLVRSVFDNRICLNVAEAAIWLGVSPRTIERLLKRGDILGKKTGRRTLVIKASVEAWLQRKE